MKQDYEYVGEPLPKNMINFQGITLESKDSVFPHIFALSVGFSTEKDGFVSFLGLDIDKNSGDPKVLQMLINRGCVMEIKRMEQNRTNSADQCGKLVEVTRYFLPYRSTAATFHLPAAEESILNVPGSEAEGLMEVKLVTSDGNFERYLHFPIHILGGLGMSFLGWVNSLNKRIQVAARQGENGLQQIGPVVNAVFFDSITGDRHVLSFSSLEGLLNTVVSVRLVRLENHTSKQYRC